MWNNKTGNAPIPLRVATGSSMQLHNCDNSLNSVIFFIKFVKIRQFYDVFGIRNIRLLVKFILLEARFSILFLARHLLCLTVRNYMFAILRNITEVHFTVNISWCVPGNC